MAISYPLRDQEGRQAGGPGGPLLSSSAQAAQTFSRVTVIYLTLARPSLRKSRVVRGCGIPLLTPRVPAGVLWGHQWGAGRLPPQIVIPGSSCAARRGRGWLTSGQGGRMVLSYPQVGSLWPVVPESNGPHSVLIAEVVGEDHVSDERFASLMHQWPNNEVDFHLAYAAGRDDVVSTDLDTLGCCCGEQHATFGVEATKPKLY